MTTSSADVVIVGGGAAGLMCALVAAERGLRVVLLEKMDQAGRKLRITGKGRCNLTNTAPLRDALPHIGPDNRWIRNAYGRFFNRELMQFFEQHGVPLTEERGGRVFPTSGRALDVFLALIQPLEQNPRVQIRRNCTVRRIEVRDGRAVAAVLQSGERVEGSHIVLATGGLSYPTTGSTGAGHRMAAEVGHTVIDGVPALVPLRCEEELPPELEGFLLKNVRLTLRGDGIGKSATWFGEMTFCHDGIAGPIALSASRVASRPLYEGKSVVATLDLKPALAPEQLDRRLIADLDANGTRLFHDALRLWLPAELVPLALKQLHIEYYKRLHQISGDERRRLCRWLKGVDFKLIGTHGFEEAIITQGGVSLDEVNPRTMESRLVSGLYLIGELLNIDADTGGYNLQLAFSTAHAAAMAF